MIRTLQNTLKQDKEHVLQFQDPYRIPSPSTASGRMGSFNSARRFSKPSAFSDINYAIASKEDKTAMFLGYSELLNALDTGSTTKITINNKRLNRRELSSRRSCSRRQGRLPGRRPGGVQRHAAWTRSPTPPTAWCRSGMSPCPSTRRTPEEARAFFDRVQRMM